MVQVGADQAAAASDVIDAADRRRSAGRQTEGRLLLSDGADPLVAQVPVQLVSTCSE